MTPKIKLNDSTAYECSFCGLSSSGTLYLDVPGLSLSEALTTFSDQNQVKTVVYSAGDASIQYSGYTNLIGIEYVLDGASVRVSLRRPYLTEGDSQALEEAKAEAAQYKTALELMGINLEEVSES